VADCCLVGVITGPKPGESPAGLGGVDGEKTLELELELARGDGFTWVFFGSAVWDGGRRGYGGSWRNLELEGRGRSRGRCAPAAPAVSAITVFISTLGNKLIGNGQHE
jgi:hypothetical protein